MIWSLPYVSNTLSELWAFDAGRVNLPSHASRATDCVHAVPSTASATCPFYIHAVPTHCTQVNSRAAPTPRYAISFSINGDSRSAGTHRTTELSRQRGLLGHEHVHSLIRKPRVAHFRYDLEASHGPLCNSTYQKTRIQPPLSHTTTTLKALTESKVLTHLP